MATGKVDIFSENICKNPVGFAAILRESGDIFFDETLGFWIVSRHNLAKQILTHEDFHIAPVLTTQQSQAAYAERYPVSHAFSRNNPFIDPVRHPLIRKLLVRAFSPSALKRIEQQIHTAIDNITRPLLTAPGTVDVASQIADPIPYAVLSSIFGVDRLLDNKAAFLHHSKQLARMIDPTLTTEEHIANEKSAVFMDVELQELVTRARANPGEDLISDFLEAADEIGGLSDDDIKYTLMALISTGSTATAFTLTLTIHALLTQHQQRAKLQADPALMESAVEELVRFAHGAKFAYRFVLRDTEVFGQQFHKGQTVLLSFAGMNNDPAVFDHPERCEFSRNNRDALSFGHGIHYCVGAHVARTEVRYLLQSFLQYAPEAKVLADRMQWNPLNFLNREISSLPVETGHH